MNRPQYSSLAALTAVVLVIILSPSLGAAEQRATTDCCPEPPKSEHFSQSTRPPMRLPVWNEDYEYSSFVVDEEKGKRFGDLNLYGIRRIDKDIRESYTIRYGKLYEGDIVPMFTAVYRVAQVDPEKNYFTVKRIDNSKLLQEIGFRPESYALPLKAGVRLQAVDFQVKSISPNEDGILSPMAVITASYAIPTDTIALRGFNLEFPKLRAI